MRWYQSSAGLHSLCCGRLYPCRRARLPYPVSGAPSGRRPGCWQASGGHAPGLTRSRMRPSLMLLSRHAARPEACARLCSRPAPRPRTNAALLCCKTGGHNAGRRLCRPRNPAQGARPKTWACPWQLGPAGVDPGPVFPSLFKRRRPADARTTCAGGRRDRPAAPAGAAALGGRAMGSSCPSPRQPAAACAGGRPRAQARACPNKRTQDSGLRCGSSCLRRFQQPAAG